MRQREGTPQQFAKLLLQGRGISEIRHYQDFLIDFVMPDESPTNMPPNVRLQLYSEWWIDDRLVWEDIAHRSSRELCGTSSVAGIQALYLMVFKMNYVVTDVKIEHDGGLKLEFSGCHTMNVSGRSSFTDLAWRIDSSDDARYSDLFIECDEGVVEVNVGAVTS